MANYAWIFFKIDGVPHTMWQPFSPAFRAYYMIPILIGEYMKTHC